MFSREQILNYREFFNQLNLTGNITRGLYFSNPPLEVTLHSKEWVIMVLCMYVISGLWPPLEHDPWWLRRDGYHYRNWWRNLWRGDVLDFLYSLSKIVCKWNFFNTIFFQLFLQVSKSQYFFPIWILIVLIIY